MSHALPVPADDFDLDEKTQPGKTRSSDHLTPLLPDMDLLLPCPKKADKWVKQGMPQARLPVPPAPPVCLRSWAVRLEVVR